MATLVLIATITTLSGFFEDPVVMNLGGPRKVTATITQEGDSYEIEVRLIPVKSFDNAMNRRLSADKAYLYARQALMRQLGGSKNQSMELRGVETLRSDLVDNRYVLTIRVPRGSVKLTNAQTKKATPKKDELEASVWTIKAKQDYLETLTSIKAVLGEEAPRFQTDLDSYYESVALSEEKCRTRLETLAKEIKADKWLLSIEAEELLHSVAAFEKDYLDCLRTEVQKAESDHAIQGDEK